MFSFMLDILEALLVLPARHKRKGERNKEWTGTVEAKRTWGLSRHAYLVVFRTDDGEKKKLHLDRKEDFDLYEEGRRYTKKAGKDLPDTDSRHP